MPFDYKPSFSEIFADGDWHSRGYLPHYDESLRYQFITYRLADSLPAHVVEELKERLNAEVVEADLSTLQDSDLIRRCQMVERYLDNGYGSCILRYPEMYGLVAENLHHFDGKRYNLLAYVIMPNHLHILIQEWEGFPLEKVLHSWRSYTAHEIIKVLKCWETAGEPPAYPDTVPGNPNGPFGYNLAGEPPAYPDTASRKDVASFGYNSAGEPPAQPEAVGILNRYFPDHKIWYWDYWDRLIRNEEHFRSVFNYILGNPGQANLLRTRAVWNEWVTDRRIYFKAKANDV